MFLSPEASLLQLQATEGWQQQLSNSFCCCFGLALGCWIAGAAWGASPGAFPSPPAHCGLLASMLRAVTHNVLVRLLLFPEGMEGLVDPVVPLSLLASRQLVTGELSEPPLWTFWLPHSSPASMAWYSRLS